jgi:hypothetical protein
MMNELLAMPLQTRIATIARDVSSKADKYREIEAHDLAEALGVSSHRLPDNEWRFIHYVEAMPLEVSMACSGLCPLDALYLIEDKLGSERFQYLSEHFELDNLRANLDILTAQEKQLLEEAIAYDVFERRRENGCGGIARFNVVSTTGQELVFEGDIEDDGACIYLRTPYDFRDGRCVDLENCLLVDEW